MARNPWIRKRGGVGEDFPRAFQPACPAPPSFAPKAKRVIYLHMVGAPSQLELFDYKPILKKYDGKECPKEYLEGQRFAFIQGIPKMLGPQFDFAQYGKSGMWMSDRLPHLATNADKLCVIKTMQSDQFNHGPAELMIHTSIAQYEMAFRMQTSVPETMTIDDEPAHIHEMYGTKPGKESFANNCLLARRLAENGVRYIQLHDWGCDSHGSNQEESIKGGFVKKCESIDKPIAALLTDLEQRGMLEETLVVWGGEFGRTSMQENRGGGVKPGISYGETDDMGYHCAKDPIHIRDLHATMLKLFGFDAKRLSYPFQGLDQKLIGVKPAKVVEGILA